MALALGLVVALELGRGVGAGAAWGRRRKKAIEMVFGSGSNEFLGVFLVLPGFGFRALLVWVFRTPGIRGLGLRA